MAHIKSFYSFGDDEFFKFRKKTLQSFSAVRVRDVSEGSLK